MAGRIHASQGDEIAFMQQWLRERRERVPDPAAHHAMHTDHEMAGMATPEHLLACMDGGGVDYAIVVHPEPYQDDHRYLEHCLEVGGDRLPRTGLEQWSRAQRNGRPTGQADELPAAKIELFVSDLRTRDRCRRPDEHEQSPCGPFYPPDCQNPVHAPELPMRRPVGSECSEMSNDTLDPRWPRLLSLAADRWSLRGPAGRTITSST